MNPVGEQPTAQEYRDFGEHQARGSSECFSRWALAVADDVEVLNRLETLPPAKRQPNLVFAAARWHGVPPGPYDALRSALLDEWEPIRATVLARATQTNEVGRCATLLPVLAGLPGPLALLEVGASAGLCLYPDRYSYRFSGDTDLALDPDSGQSSVVLECEVHGDPPLPSALPQVVWRAGLDLNPLDVGDDDAMRWLETLVWPEHEDRRRRLAAAVDLARADPPRVVRGDLNEQLPALAAEAPEEATLVVFHSAVTAYLSDIDRERFVTTVADLPGHWVSNEGPRAVPGVADTARGDPPSGPAPFLLALDGRAVAWAESHGRALWWHAGG
jgi:Uncharacterized protein conserved in bacteria (DUF2332)